MKIKVAKITVLLLFLFSFYISCKAQTTDRLPCINKTFSIVVHVVKDTSKTGTNFGLFNPLQPPAFKPLIQTSIDSLNNHFAPICVSFEICDYQYIPNYWYLDLSTMPGYVKKFEEMQVLYNVKDRINLYYVKNIGSGLTHYVFDSITNLNDGGIVLQDSNYGNILQAMGRYFGLKTTFDIPGELVNGTNSSTTGDLITDTPADPNGAVDGSCKFVSTLKDANRQYYNPIIGNAMSGYPYKCLCISPYAFTREQYKKMAKTYLSKTGMW